MNEVAVAESLRGSFLEAVLLQLNESGGRMSSPALDAFTGRPDATVEVLSALHRYGLAEQPDFSSGGVLTPFGARTAELIRQSLLPGGQRRADAVQRAVLTWLRGRSVAPGSIHEFLTQPQSTVFGLVVETRELLEAAKLLEARGFIEGATSTSEWLLLPSVTPDGVAALMSNVLISEYGKANATMVNNDYSNRVSFGDHANVAAVAAGGAGNEQQVFQVIGAAPRNELAAKVSELQDLVRGLDGGEEITAALNDLSKEVATPAPRTAVIKDLAIKLSGAAMVAVGTDAGQAVVHAVPQLLQLLN